MAISDAATGYVYFNVGVNAPLADTGMGYVYSNVGINSPIADTGMGYVHSNVGLELAERRSISQPQLGWGTPLIPEQVVELVTAMSVAVGYVTEGDVT